jgi:hypothetical protein
MTATVLVALLAAVCFALASVLQHRGAVHARRRAPLHPGLMAELAAKPGWLAGALVQAAGVTLHLFAVNLGPLSVVQPVLTLGLVIALVLQRLAGRPVGRAALLSAGLVVLGLTLFLIAQPGLAQLPAGGPASTADAAAWLPGLAMSGVLLALTLGGGLAVGAGAGRCVLFGASAGVLMATSAALGKAWGSVLGTSGLFGLLGSWQLWAALVCGAGGTLLSQAAFQAGALSGSLGAMMAIDPVVGVALGVVVFAEPFADPETWPLRVLGLGLTLLGVGLLARLQRTTPEPAAAPLVRAE